MKKKGEICLEKKPCSEIRGWVSEEEGAQSTCQDINIAEKKGGGIGGAIRTTSINKLFRNTLN